MRYTATSIDDPTLGTLDYEHAYVSPVSGVLANHVYNALLTGRPYYLQLIEDVEIAARFARVRLGARSVSVTAEGAMYSIALRRGSGLFQAFVSWPAAERSR